MKWWQVIFKGRLDSQKVFNSISNGLDSLNFSTEERSEFNLKVADKMADHAKESLSESTVRSKTRRFIAVFLIINIMAIIWLMIIMSLLGHDVLDILAIVQAFGLGAIFFTIIAFFFGGYYLKAVNFKTKKDKNNDSE